MRRLFDEDMSMDDLKKVLKKVRGKQNTNGAIIFVVITMIIVFFATVAFLFHANKKHYLSCACENDGTSDFEDDDIDENGCCYTDSSDFE